MTHRPLAWAALAGAAFPVSADVIHVPVDAGSIQQAIDMSADGDEIIVAPGVYIETIDLLGRAVTLRSSKGADMTTIDGRGADTVVRCESGEQADTVIEGFTITGGQTAIGGGGIRIVASEPTFNDCIVEGNHAMTGGGFYVLNASPAINGCTIRLNTASFAGGGLYASGGDPTCSGCSFEDNSGENQGGAAYAFGASPVFLDSVFSGNEAEAGGAIATLIGQPAVARCLFIENIATAGDGGALQLLSRPVTAVNCTFERNQASGRGGAIYISGDLEPTLLGLLRCRLLGNTAGQHGGGVYHAAGVTLFALNSLFSGNAATGSAASRGGAVSSWDLDTTRSFSSCTFASNSSAGLAGGLFDVAPGQRTMRNCIVYGNTDGAQNPLEAQMSGALLSAVLDHSCVEGLPVARSGNIADDPQFLDAAGKDGMPGTADDDLRLAAGSPCIDAGRNSAVPPGLDTDLAGEPRRRDDPRTIDTGVGIPPLVDIGAYEFQPRPAACDADVNGDGMVGPADLDAVLDAWGPCPECAEDVDGNGAVDVDDLIAVILGWGVCG